MKTYSRYLELKRATGHQMADALWKRPLLYDRDANYHFKNNQNNIMKTWHLAAIVIIHPTMIFSATGMNFKDNEIQLNRDTVTQISFYRLYYECQLTLYLITKNGSKQGVYN